MKNIAQAVKSATDKTLILLDELGSGTDPQEGTAIAMAVLDKLIEKKSFVLVTTHQGILKNYGYTNEYCINASVEFNQNTLSPNYHLLMGVPGESHALDIAKKSGLPSEICKAAQDYILTEQADVSALIRGLNLKNKLKKKRKRIKINQNLKNIRKKNTKNLRKKRLLKKLIETTTWKSNILKKNLKKLRTKKQKMHQHMMMTSTTMNTISIMKTNQGQNIL